MRILLALCAAAMLLGGCVTAHPEQVTRLQPPAPTTPKIDWSVDNRFRLINSAEEEERFHAELSTFIEAYKDWFEAEPKSRSFPNILDADLIYEQRGAAKPPGRNYAVNYNPVTGSYRCRNAGEPLCQGGRDWITDTRRHVRLGIAAWSGRQCDWTVDGQTSTGPCDAKTLEVVLDHPRDVTARQHGGSETLTEKVLVQDLKIVALGDSFSAGEGNPHVQWRFFRPPSHPALWLDARCHRSLMSGPALSAAYLAQHNQHLSVTLLHYGCSGASVADGLVTPWALIETDAGIRRRYKAFNNEAGAAEVSGKIGRYDIPPTQLAQAARDLTIDGAMIHPDIVLLSAGGNDVGFADIVTALVAPPFTEVDLKPHATKDDRPYATFDQAGWVKASEVSDCGEARGVPCLGLRIKERRSGDEARHPTLFSQYALLAPKLADLTGQAPAHVFISEYPNFMMRARDDTDPSLRRSNARDATGCVDRPFDGRPGFIPGILAWIPGFGLRPKVASQAVERILKPLNRDIASTTDRFGWTVVDTHVENGYLHGYCSFQRYYNTLTDSYENQGRTYGTPRPMGNFVLLQADDRFHMPVGTQVAWDPAGDCYKRYDHGALGAECLADSDPAEPVYELERTASAAHPTLSNTSSLGTSGPVHPNLFGHCNYASAIVTRIVRQAGDAPGRIVFDKALVDQVRDAGPNGLEPDAVCAPEAWGYARHKPARP